MKIAIQNIHVPLNPNGAQMHAYIGELLKQGLVTHLFFDKYDLKNDTSIKDIWKKYGFKELGLEKVRIIFTSKELNDECDMLINFSSSPEQFTPAVKAFKGIKIFHLMDYFWNEPGSVKYARLKEYGIDYLFAYGSPDRYCTYFQHYFPDYKGKVIPVPFGYNGRFVQKVPFAERVQKCVALGSVRPLRFPDERPELYLEVANFHSGEKWFHKFRRMLVENAASLQPVMDSMLPVFPHYRDYDYDMVKKFNEYQLFVSDESIFYFPSAKAYEGPACGTAMVCSDHACFKDFGFADGVNCIMHKEFDIEDFRRKISAALADQEGSTEIAFQGKKFVEERYSHPIMAEKISFILQNIIGKGLMDKKNLADECYKIWKMKERELPIVSERNNENDRTSPKFSGAEKLRDRFFYTYAGALYFTAMESRFQLRRAYRKMKKIMRPSLQSSLSTKIEIPVLPEPNVPEKKRIDELRAGIQSLPPEKWTSVSAAERKWISFKLTLREKIMTADPRLFLTWGVIKNNMGYRIEKHELAYLQNRSDWELWEKALPENKDKSIFQPHLLKNDITENSLRQAYHLAHFLDSTHGTDIAKIDRIIDLGGGYGTMCQVAYSLGFRGEYIIFDWPEFSLLQRYYLNSIGIDLKHLRFVNSLNDLKDIVERSSKKNDLLIATWSLSETPLEFRKEFLSIVKPKYYLICYQRSFGGIDNNAYFSELGKNTSDKITWKTIPMSFIKSEGNNYFIGVKKDI